MFWNLLKSALLAIAMVLIVIVFGGVTSTSADAPQSAPPTVVLPTPVGTKPPPRATPAAPAAPVRVMPTATKAAASVRRGASPRFAFPSYTTSINLLNLDAATANIQLTYYNQDGTAPSGSPFTDSIAGNASQVYFPIPGVSAGFSGSVIISSNTQLGSIVNVVGTGTQTALDSYVGASSGSNTVQLPLLMANNSGLYTWFDVQNAGTVAATVNVAYSDTTSNSATINPGASATFSQQAETHSQKVFSGVVSNSTTNQPLVVAAIEESSATMSAYTGFGGGATNPVMPLVNIQPSKGIITGITIQNTGAASNVTVSYTPDPGLGLGSACTETQSVPAGGNAVFALAAFANGANSNCAAGSTFVGSAAVTGNSASVPLTVIVNQAVPGFNDGAYAGFDPSKATSTVVMPLIMDRNGSNQVFTSFSLVNVGSGSTTVTCSFTGTSYTAGTPKPLAAGAGFTMIQNGNVQNNYVGAGTCTAANSTDKIVAIVNQLSTVAPGDQLLVYNAINQ